MSLKRIVYVLKSAIDPERYYTGLTSDIAANNLRPTTREGARTRHRVSLGLLTSSSSFPTNVELWRSNGYLKSGSGVVFAKRHLR